MAEYLAKKRTDETAAKPLRLTAQTAAQVRRGFGLDPAALHLEESEAVRAMGARAVAKGNVIRFAPGEFAPDTREGMETLGHELEHVRGQASGEVPMTGGPLEQPAYEAAADRAGEAFASGSLSAAGPVAPTQSAAAPAQAKGPKTLKLTGKLKKQLSALQGSRMEDGKRKWDLIGRDTVSPEGREKNRNMVLYETLSQPDARAVNAERRKNFSKTFSSSERGMRSEIQDLFESGAGSLLDLGVQDFQRQGKTGLSTYATMQGEMTKVRTNGRAEGSIEAGDAYTLASEDFNRRALNLVQGSKKFEDFDPTEGFSEEQEQEANRLIPLLYEELAKELENPQSLMAGIADRFLEMMNQKLSFTKMEGGVSQAERFMLNDMILKTVGPYLVMNGPGAGYARVGQAFIRSATAPLEGKDSPYTQKFNEVITRYKQGKESQASAPEPAPSPAPVSAPAPTAAAPAAAAAEEQGIADPSNMTDEQVHANLQNQYIQALASGDAGMAEYFGSMLKGNIQSRNNQLAGSATKKKKGNWLTRLFSRKG